MWSVSGLHPTTPGGPGRVQTLPSLPMNTLRPLAATTFLLLPACLDADDEKDGEEEDGFEHSAFELELHDLVNAHRESVGLEPLDLEAAYSEIARGHSATCPTVPSHSVMMASMTGQTR